MAAQVSRMAHSRLPLILNQSWISGRQIIKSEAAASTMTAKARGIRSLALVSMDAMG
jgi:hypothetical protein